MLFRELRIEKRDQKYAERRAGRDRRVQATAIPTERRCRILPTAQAVADRRKTITTTQSLSLTPFPCPLRVQTPLPYRSGPSDVFGE